MQDEPKNQGPWTFMQPRIRNLLEKIGNSNNEAMYTGRTISPSTATGYGKMHAAEAATTIERAFE